MKISLVRGCSRPNTLEMQRDRLLQIVGTLLGEPHCAVHCRSRQAGFEQTALTRLDRLVLSMSLVQWPYMRRVIGVHSPPHVLYVRSVWPPLYIWLSELWTSANSMLLTAMPGLGPISRGVGRAPGEMPRIEARPFRALSYQLGLSREDPACSRIAIPYLCFSREPTTALYSPHTVD